MNGQPEDIDFFDAGPPEWGMTLDQAARDRARSDDPVAINQAKKEILFERKARIVSDFSQSFIASYDDMSNKVFMRNLHEVQEYFYQRDNETKDYQGSWSFFVQASEREQYRMCCAEMSIKLVNSLIKCDWLVNHSSFILAKEEFIKREPKIVSSYVDKDADNTPLNVQLDLAFMRVVTGGLMMFYSPQKYENQLIDVELISPFQPSEKSKGLAKRLAASLRADGIRSQALELSLEALREGDLPPKEFDPVRYNENVWSLGSDARRDLLIRECDLIGRRLFNFPAAGTSRFPAEIIRHIIEITNHPSMEVRSIRRKLAALEKEIEPEKDLAYGLRRIKNFT